MPYDDPLLKEFIGYLRMKSRYLLVGLSDEDKQKIEELTEKKEERKVVRKRLSEKSCQKTSNKIVALLKKNAKITQNEIAKTLGISRQAVQKHLANLKIAGRLQRIGPDKVVVGRFVRMHKVCDNFQSVEGCKVISPHHFHPTNGVRPADSISCSLWSWRRLI